ncbi:hypothetical protein [Streptomyces europaeiscabiei]|uniref:hypothetical protein n=1 Tax=Streptomyces europaeiscabiei TaxID=146819 RepID=UPI002E2A0762|nr:hypothetical protein [Streptomyces europaeiscabiei]
MQDGVHDGEEDPERRSGEDGGDQQADMLRGAGEDLGRSGSRSVGLLAGRLQPHGPVEDRLGE